MLNFITKPIFSACLNNKQLITFVSIGLINNLIGYSLYLFLTYLGIEPKKAMTLLFLLIMFTGFFFNRKYTFTDQKKLLFTSIGYSLIYLFGYLANLVILIIFVDHLKLQHQLIQAFATFFIALINFILLKFFIFKCKK
jgi:putative flippase GtrA